MSEPKPLSECEFKLILGMAQALDAYEKYEAHFDSYVYKCEHDCCSVGNDLLRNASRRAKKVGSKIKSMGLRFKILGNNVQPAYRNSGSEDYGWELSFGNLSITSRKNIDGEPYVFKTTEEARADCEAFMKRNGWGKFKWV